MAYEQLPISGGKSGAIRTENIYAVLDVAPRATGYDLGYICCNTHGKTNMWARYKPEAIGGPAPITDAQRQANNYGLIRSDAAEGTQRAYKLNLGSDNGIPSLLEVKWAYKPPTLWDYHRIEDWAGYEHKAAAPSDAATDVDFPLNKSEIQIFLSKPKINTINSLSLSDFGYCQGLYFCVVIYTVNTRTGKLDSILGYKTANSQIGDTLASDSTSVTFTRSELTIALSGYELHYAKCFCDAKRTEWGAISDVNLYPIVTNDPPTGKITISTSAPVNFVLEGVGNTIYDGYVSDSLTRYSLSQNTGSTMTICALGVARNSGTITFYGYFNNPGSGTQTINIPPPIDGVMQPTLSGSSGRAVPTIYVKNNDGSYSAAQSTVTVTAGQKKYVALSFPMLCYIPKDNAAWQQPPSGVEYKQVLCQCRYQAAGTSTTSALLFSKMLYVCPFVDDKLFVVNQLAQ